MIARIQQGVRRTGRTLSIAPLFGALVGCHLPGASAQRPPEAEFGLFFGGQIQEREQIPFDLTGRQGTPGFRVTFPAGAPPTTVVRWELSKPDPTQRAHLPKVERRRTELGQRSVTEGSLTFDQNLPLAPGDPLGLWNIRVTAGRNVLLDRPFSVVTPRTLRLRREAQEQSTDGGFL